MIIHFISLILLFGCLYWYLRIGPLLPLYRANVVGFAALLLFALATLFAALSPVPKTAVYPAGLFLFAAWSVTGGPKRLAFAEVFARAKCSWFDRLLTRTRL